MTAQKGTTSFDVNPIKNILLPLYEEIFADPLLDDSLRRIKIYWIVSQSLSCIKYMYVPFLTVTVKKMLKVLQN